MQHSLTDLPNELLTTIINYIDDATTLRTLARSCSQLQNIVEPLLYQHVFHRTGEAAVKLRHAVLARPERADSIQVIDSRCKWQRQQNLISLATVSVRMQCVFRAISAATLQPELGIK